MPRRAFKTILIGRLLAFSAGGPHTPWRFNTHDRSAENSTSTSSENFAPAHTGWKCTHFLGSSRTDHVIPPYSAGRPRVLSQEALRRTGQIKVTLRERSKVNNLCLRKWVSKFWFYLNFITKAIQCYYLNSLKLSWSILIIFIEVLHLSYTVTNIYILWYCWCYLLKSHIFCIFCYLW